ncbi:class I glutamine amidotransferase-like protein [Cucurbitaria berberidis CBS 394.84]|uniref:Class I glutamine amidotransferase-like protein n=1 Tax=Cucurbitaria berberidis CBS 394.84 TaxID=1168544 RepID=A0A9P4GJK6_9PLEO|nr:class I glutamine amidotransferase-like protein [Cucurbitaria berberidis CBS 394.84]KAF1846765.1 class I glutamine amidotransferase-like protein [Cucurbitaria berberidis CBS 394.84]
MKTPLRIAILQCDTPPPDVIAEYGKYDRIFTTLLETAAGGVGLSPKQDLELSAFDVVTAQEYPDLENIDAVLISGSKHNSFDNEAWILKLVDFTKKLLNQDRIRIIGVCFGHQILGRAAGVKVGRSDDGWEISVLPVQLTAKGKEIFQQDSLAIHQMHKDIVFEYPEGVEKLGGSPRCLVQGMYKKGRLISVQGHPEFNQGIVTHLVKMRQQQGIFEDEQARDALERVGRPHDGVTIAKAFLRFLLED